MRFESTCLFFGILAMVSAAPRRIIRSYTMPAPWHMPCGEVIEQLGPDDGGVQDFKKLLGELAVQYGLTLQDYLNRDYEYLYNRVRMGVQDHQYIPNWVPGKKDSDRVKELAKSNPEMIVAHFPEFHTDLQKFAVAFEEMIEDETSSNVQEALKATQNYLIKLLCELEASIAGLPFPSLTRIERNIMNDIERDPEDDTRRLIRDWGVLLKYKDYLFAWKDAFGY